MDKNKMFDVIVIGAGAAGLNIAGFMNRVGFRVLLIDKSDRNIGGDCLNYGCVPSKALIHVARVVRNAREAHAFGLRAEGGVEMEKVRDFIQGGQEEIRVRENADYFRGLGMTVVLGEARFSGKNTVEVNGETYQGKKIVIATGLYPRKLDIPGSDQVAIYNNETIFNISTLPERLLVVGGGPIGLEIGQAFRHLGSQVTIVNNTEQLLPREDAEIADLLLWQFKKEGIKVYNSHTAKHFSSPRELVIQGEDGKEITVEFDAVFAAVGREANTDSLALEKAGIATDGQKIVVDEYLRTSNKNILVCGDAAGMEQFTHAAELHAGVILQNFFSPLKKKLNRDTLAWVTFTYPEVATFGLNEHQLKERGITYEILEDDFTHDDRAIIDRYPTSKVKLFVSKDKLLGGTMLAPQAGELIQELILARSSNLPLSKVFARVYPYPTATRINKKVIGGYFAQKLTSFTKKVLHILFH
jgi:pyruvate/2-oxoglutarate dehydrogenase complex dihydrolipoamide dehydrogenase (E3) component